jgi:predicted nuclease of restriction endonuclease-like (RecB) superfamily
LGDLYFRNNSHFFFAIRENACKVDQNHWRVDATLYDFLITH